MAIRIILVLLGLSYLLSVSAVPATRTHNLNTQYNPALPFSTHQLENGGMMQEREADMEEGGFIEMRRMAYETHQDYGSGGGAEANTVHDPKIPS